MIMEGKTHVLSGAAVVSIGYRLIAGAPIIEIADPSYAGLCFIGAAIVGAIVPDLDIPESTASNRMTSLGVLIYKRIIEVLLCLAFGYFCMMASKGLSINLIYVVGVIALLYYGMSRRVMHYVKLVIQFLIVLILLYFFITTKQAPYILIAAILTMYIISKHRGFSHTSIINLFADGVVYYSLYYYGYSQIAMTASICFLVGTFTHLYLNDLLTNKGVPNPLYPFDAIVKFILGKGLDLSVRKIKLPVTFSTGGGIEIVISIIAIIGLSFGLDIFNQIKFINL